VVEVAIDSVRVSLISQHRVVVLRDESQRYLPIWIGPFEADAITIELQNVDVARPLTHDLLKATIQGLGASVSHVVVNGLSDNTFYASVVLDIDGRSMEVDSRPSDAIALAVRAKAPIYVEDSVMERAGIVPSKDISASGEEEEDLSAFRDFVDTLDLDDLPGE
jgi:bifunctional DNase/RNase